MNKVTLIGRTTKSIDLRYTTGQTQTAVARFTLAVNRRKKDETDFISCVAFGKTAETMEKYVGKGHRVGIIGHIQTGSYEKDGHRVYTTDVIVDELEFLEPKHQETHESQYEGFDEIDEDLPF
jgi:single-strand DNA-binding protein